MPQASLEARRWLARVRAGDGRVCGAAFAVDERHLLTCAHVVQEAGAAGPEDRVFLDFPLLGHAGSAAVVLEEGWASPAETGGDTALLQLESPPPGLEAVPLRSMPSLADQPFVCYGFPEGFDTSLPAEGYLGLATGLEWVTVKASSEVPIQRGFSGGAVWSRQLGAVTALMATRDSGSKGRVAFAIPIKVIAARSPLIADALPTALDLDPHRETHWGPRSRGVSRDDTDAGWFFSGRRDALQELVSWLMGEQPPALRVVTGTPGCGKSAVLARLVTAADRHYRRRIPGLQVTDPAVPPPNLVDVTIRASGATIKDAVARIAETTGLAAADPDQLVAELVRSKRRLVIVADALDEAADARKICWLLADLANRGSARVLAGCREHLLSALPDPDPIRLDQPPYLHKSDVVAYVQALLTATRPQAASELAQVAREVTDAADCNFLIAQLTTLALTAGGTASRPFPHTVQQAMDRLIDTLPSAEAQAARDLLLPLAYAAGDGFPAGDELWLQATAALRRPYHQADLDDLLRSPAGSFLTARLHGPQGPTYRLFHQALADSLTAARQASRDQQRIWAAWDRLVPRRDQDRDWSAAPPYLRLYACVHAVAAGSLGQLLSDTGYLLNAEMTRLLQLLPARPEPSEAGIVAVLRLAGSAAAALPPVPRARLLALAAAHLGLTGLQHAFAAQVNDRWIPLWAHTLPPHQALVGHIGPVRAVAVGRAGHQDVIVSGGDDGTVRVWDAAGRPAFDPLVGHIGPVRAVAIGRARHQDVIVAGGEGGIRLWIAATGKVRERSPFESALLPLFPDPEVTGIRGVTALAMGRAGDRDVIVYVGDGKTEVWQHAGYWRVDCLSTRGIRPLAKAAMGRGADGDVIVSASSDGEAHLWDALTRRQLTDNLVGQARSIQAVAVGEIAGRQMVVAGADDGVLWAWEAAAGDPAGGVFAQQATRVNAVAIGRAGYRDVIASGGDDGTVRIWDGHPAQLPGNQLTGHNSVVETLAIGRYGDQDVIVSGGDDGIRIWDAATGRPVKYKEWMTEHDRRNQGVKAVAIGQDGRWDLIVSASHGDRIKAEPRDGLRMRPSALPTVVPDAPPVATETPYQIVVAFDRGGRPRLSATPGIIRAPVAIGQISGRYVVVTGHDDGTLRIRNTMLTCVSTLGVDGPRITAVAIGNIRGRDVIVSGDLDGTVQVWDAAAGQLLGRPLTGDDRQVTAVAAGQVRGRDVVISGGDDGKVRVRDITAGTAEILHMLDSVTALAISPTHLAVASGIAIAAFSLPR